MHVTLKVKVGTEKCFYAITKIAHSEILQKEVQFRNHKAVRKMQDFTLMCRNFFISLVA